MKHLKQWSLLTMAVVASMTLLVGACRSEEEPTAVPTPVPTATEEPVVVATADLVVLSNSSPHITMIDGETNEVSSTADIPDFTKWTWNDDNNYFDGTNLWLGMKHPDTNEVEVIALNLDTLELSARIAIGPDSKSLYLGQANEDGILLVGKMGFNQVIEIDTKNFTVGSTWDIPTGEDGVVCDVDVAQGSDGVERAFIPTDKSDMVLSINTATGEVLAEFKTSESGIRPFMLSAAPDGKTVWVQERGSNGNAVLDAITLELISRVPTGTNAIMNTFSPDGTVSYTAHSKDTVVVANSSQAPFAELWRAEVGTNPVKVGVHPNGQWVYATISKESAIAVIDASTGVVVRRIEIGTDPNSIFVRERA